MSTADTAKRKRNRYVLTLDVEMTLPIPDDSATHAAELLAHDVRNYLKNHEWGWGRARIESVYPNPSVRLPGYVPEGAEA